LTSSCCPGPLSKLSTALKYSRGNEKKCVGEPVRCLDFHRPAHAGGHSMAEEKRSREKLTVAVEPPIKRCSVAPTSSTSQPSAVGQHLLMSWASELAGQPAIRLTAATVLGAGGDAVCALLAGP
jgi:hypothetical protein